jgi:PAS domain S-box-containing protein
MSELPPSAQTTNTSTGLSVLVVDDETVSRTVLCRMLERLGFDVHQAADGRSALAQLAEHKHDIILLDLMMPVMDGFETTRRVRALPSHLRTPILVISALESTESIVSAIEAGADDYLIKPVRPPIIKAKLRHLAEGLLAKKAQAEEAARNRAIGETVVDALITVNAWGVIEWLNPATERMFGYQSVHMLGSNLSTLMPEPFNGMTEDALAQQLAHWPREPRGVRQRTQGISASGKPFPIELAVEPLFIQRRQAFLVMVRDMSDLEQLGKMKRDFISVINHELRTPLTSIIGSLSLLAAGAAGELPPKAQKLVGMAERNTARLGRLINDILDLDKIAAGGLRLKLAVLPALGLLKEAVAVNESGAAKRQVSLALETTGIEAEQPALWVDSDRFQQVMSNLLTNAVKFSPPDGVITVRAHLEGAHIQISVTDQGSGIPLEFQPQIFQRFAQHETPDTRRNEGTGLGLSIAKALVTQMQGTIGFESTPGEGTTFFFTLPLAAANSNLHSDA